MCMDLLEYYESSRSKTICILHNYHYLDLPVVWLNNTYIHCLIFGYFFHSEFVYRKLVNTYACMTKADLNLGANVFSHLFI